MNKIIITVLGLVIIACHREKSDFDKKENQTEKNSVPFISSIDKCERNLKLISEFPGLTAELIYLGKNTDSIVASITPFDIYMPDLLDENKLKGDFHDYMIFPYDQDTNLIELDKAKLTLVIDTSQLICHHRFNTVGYPLLIKNNETQSVVLGNEYTFAYISMEAELSHTKWIEVFPATGLMCGTDVNFFKLPSKEIALVVVPKLRGHRLVKCRLKLGNNYSNEFYQYIDEQTF
ncbi:MAG: hypothetical protein KJ941_03855 [Bacteroidetes bacterium]|nr:hypothetical protein [Bacteroidota bacterium]